MAALKLLTETEPGKWTIGEYAKAFICPLLADAVTDRPFVKFEINNVLPVPPDDIPLDDLLALRSKRKDEFRALRIAIDELYDDVAINPIRFVFHKPFTSDQLKTIRYPINGD